MFEFGDHRRNFDELWPFFDLGLLVDTFISWNSSCCCFVVFLGWAGECYVTFGFRCFVLALLFFCFP